MITIGIAMVRDEADIIVPVVEHMLTQVDEIVIADNGSVDGTWHLLNKLPVTLLEDDEVGYYQSAKMTGLAEIAREMGADWVVPFDADEIWYAREHGRIADMLADVAPQWLTVAADLYDHVATAKDDPADENPISRIGWRRRDPAPLPKVACRAREDLTIHQGNHDASYTGGSTMLRTPLVVRHFPYRSPAQFVRKARNGLEAYEATDLPENLGAHWRGYGRILRDHGEDACRYVFHEWFWSGDPDQDDTLLYDPAQCESRS